jgi:hypothetical protein
MKRTVLFLLLLAVLSAVSGFFMSKASWLGRVGMTFFYKEYNLLKVWWQGAIAVFIVFILLYLLHTAFQSKLHIAAARTLHVIMLLLALVALYFTYDDFSNDFSHHLLGWRFHLGFYLIWAGWILICFNFLFKKKPHKNFPIDPNSKAPANQ